MPELPELLILAYATFGLGVPGYVIARRRNLRFPFLAFLPFVGLWITLFRSVGKGGWPFALLVSALIIVVPFVGLVGVSVWTGLEVPPRHGRSPRWKLPLVVPVLNVLAYWPYAFTLPRQTPPTLSADVGADLAV